MESIRARSRALQSENKVRPFIISAAFSLATIATAAAYGPTIYHGVKLWISGNKVGVVVDSFTMVREPRSVDVQTMMKRAAFPVVLPVGMPTGTHLKMLAYAPSDRPNFVFLQYTKGPAKFNKGFSIFDSSAVITGNPIVAQQIRTVPSKDIYRWQVGGETVLVSKQNVVEADIERIKAAMSRATPQSSVAATEPLLSRALVLGASPALPEIAARYAKGGSVVIGPQFVRDIPSLAKSGHAIVNSNTVDLTHIPNIHGEPDYKHATLRWEKATIVSAQGVRAIAAVLQQGGGAQCRCAIVFATTPAWYSVAKVWPERNFAIERYTVNARTLAVTQVR